MGKYSNAINDIFSILVGVIDVMENQDGVNDAIIQELERVTDSIVSLELRMANIEKKLK